MVLQRDVDSLPESRFENTDTGVINAYFAKIEGTDDDFGILRFTTLDHDWVGNLDPRPQYGEDSGDHNWRGGDVAPQEIRISQNNTSILDPSSISFPNVRDEVETSTGYWMNLDTFFGLKNRVVTIWHAWWPAGEPDDVDLDGRYILFRGRIGTREHGEWSVMQLNPFRSSWRIDTGRAMLPTVCSFAVSGMFKEPTTCQYAGAETECDGTPQTCELVMDNISNYGGHPLMLKPNTVIYVGGQRFTV